VKHEETVNGKFSLDSSGTSETFDESIRAIFIRQHHDMSGETK
jgi:hypothetical protein